MGWRRFKQTLMISLLVISLAAGGLWLLAVQGDRWQSVQTSSMSPGLQKGDLITAKKVPVSELKLGDVITFTNPADRSSTLTRRLIEMPSAENGQRFFTSGDAKPLPDQPIVASDIVGRVDRVLPLAGYAIDFMRRPWAPILLIYLPAAILLAVESRRLIRHYRNHSYVLKGYDHHTSDHPSGRGWAIGAK